MIYSGKLWKIIMIRQVYEKLEFGPESGLCVGKVLTPYNTRLRVVLLIKHANLMWFSKY